MQKNLTPLVVAAAALIDANGLVLMQKRRQGRAHGGLWEFPGGKIEPGETPETGLCRELAEELGIAVAADDLSPLAFSTGPGTAGRSIVILLYVCRKWSGTAECLDAQELEWFSPLEIPALDMPPLDVPLAAAVQVAFENSGQGLP